MGRLIAAIRNQSLTANDLLAGYCALIYGQCRNYEEVARRTQLDRRTVKRHISNTVI